MLVGLSKSLGKGTRIGIGMRLNKSRKKRGPTQRELAEQDKEKFLERVSEESQKALENFLYAYGIEFEVAYEYNIDLNSCFTQEDAKQQYNEFENTIVNIKNTLKKIKFGGSLTSKRRDSLVDDIFKLHELIPTGRSPLDDFYEQAQKQYEQKIKKLNVRLAKFTVITSLILSTLMMTKSHPFITFIGALIYTFIFVGIIWFCIFAFMRLQYKVAAKKYVKNKAKELLKEKYGVNLGSVWET